MSYLKAIVALSVVVIMATGTGGCTKSNEKTLSANANGEASVNCKLELIHVGDNNVNYKVKIKYNDSNHYSEQLRKKLHEEAKRKFDIYVNLKKYCEESKIQSICDSLNFFLLETKATTLDVPYEIKLYSDKNIELASISHNISYEINQKDFLKGDGIEIENRLNMNRATFDDISRLEVKNGLL